MEARARRAVEPAPEAVAEEADAGTISLVVKVPVPEPLPVLEPMPAPVLEILADGLTDAELLRLDATLLLVDRDGPVEEDIDDDGAAAVGGVAAATVPALRCSWRDTSPLRASLSLADRADECEARRALRSTTSTSAGVFAAVYAFKIDTSVIEPPLAPAADEVGVIGGLESCSMMVSVSEWIMDCRRADLVLPSLFSCCCSPPMMPKLEASEALVLLVDRLVFLE